MPADHGNEMSETLFTIDGARRALDRIRPAAEEICRIYRDLQSGRCGRAAASDAWIDPQYFAGVERIHGWLGEFGRVGVQVKDLKTGLLDFPVTRAGRLVLLCWRVGEPSLGFWHETEAGFAGRRPFDDDGPWDQQDPAHDPCV